MFEYLSRVEFDNKMPKRPATYVNRSVKRQATGRKYRPSKRSTFRQKYGSLTKAVKRIARNMNEPKNVDGYYTKTDIKHNLSTGSFQLNTVATAGTFCVLPAQGDTQNTRDGNKIYLKGISVRLLLGWQNDRLNTTFRVIIQRRNKGLACSTYEDLFDNITGNCLLDPFDRDKGTVMSQKFIKVGAINPGVPTTGKEYTKAVRLYIPINKVVTFTGNADLTNNLASDYWISIYGYDAYGTLTTDTVGYVQYFARSHFKDM